MASSIDSIALQSNEASKVLLPTIFRIFEAWRMTDLQQIRLLGITDEETLGSWKKCPDKVSPSPDLIERASYILGIYKALQALFPTDENADRWLITGNDHALFNGQAPVERLMSANMVELAAVRGHLDSVIG